MLNLILFGVPQAHYHEHTLKGFPNQQPSLLLCYLLLNRQRSHYREQIAAIFWEEYPAHVARKYLRNSIWKMRKMLQSSGAPDNEYLSVENGGISFISSSCYRLDIEAFEAKVLPCQDIAGQQLTLSQITCLEEAVDLYTGDLLEGIYEDWCLYDRERLRLLYLNALSKLMAFHEVNGAYERGLAYGERILAQDDTREKVHRQMMRLHWLSGNQGAALAQYKRCAQILRQALDAPPMEATTRLYRRMVRGQFRPTHRWDYGDTFPLSVPPSSETQTAAEHALQRVRYLRATIDEASVELRRLEHLIGEEVLNFSVLTA